MRFEFTQPENSCFLFVNIEEAAQALGIADIPPPLSFQLLTSTIIDLYGSPVLHVSCEFSHTTCGLG